MILRERVLVAADDGLRLAEFAALFRLSVSHVSKVLSWRHRTDQRTALPLHGHLPPKLAALHDAIRTQVTARKDSQTVGGAVPERSRPRGHHVCRGASLSLTAVSLLIIDNGG
jgi:hypothetical protein